MSEVVDAATKGIPGTRRGDRQLNRKSDSMLERSHDSRASFLLSRRIRLVVLSVLVSTAVSVVGAVAASSTASSTGTATMGSITAVLAARTGDAANALFPQPPEVRARQPVSGLPPQCALKYAAVLDLAELGQRYGKSSDTYLHAFGSVAGQMHTCDSGSRPLTSSVATPPSPSRSQNSPA